MNLVEMRTRVRQDLFDTDPGAYDWTDDQIDGAIQRAVRDYSHRSPIQQISDLATTVDSVELNISSLTDLMYIDSIEFPLGQTRPHMQRFTFYAGKVFMRDPGDGTNARVRWAKAHTLAVGSTTIPDLHDEIIVLGATSHLAMSMSAKLVDKATIAGRFGTLNYRAWAHDRLVLYQQQLTALVRKLQQKELYTDD
jgi:hypothetical protein